MKRLDFYNHDAFFWTLVLLFYTSAVLLYTVKIYSGAIFFLILGTILILSLFNKSDSLLKIEVNNSQITFFHTENKKKCSRTFSFNELKSFILEISHMVNYNKSPFSKSREPVNLSFKVTNTQDELFVYYVILPSFLNIAKVFE